MKRLSQKRWLQVMDDMRRWYDALLAEEEARGILPKEQEALRRLK